jgi:hypothetical protein
MEVSAMVSRAACETMALDDALEALALGNTGDLDLIADREDIHGHGVAHRQLVLTPHFHQVALGAHARLLQVAELGFGEPLGLDVPEGDLRGDIPVGLHRLLLSHQAGPGLDHGAAHDGAVFFVELGHAQLLA